MDNPIVDLGKLSEPLTKLVDVVGKGIGTLYSPWGTVRQAKADAKAKIIIAKSENDIADLNLRAKSRFEYQESVKQHNLEQITVHAAKALPQQVSDKDVDKGWIFQFFDYAQQVCDEDMQVLWGKILAGETSQPGSFSKRTLNFLKTIDKEEAEQFTEYCRFLFFLDDGWPFVVLNDACKKQMSDSFNNLDMTSHFESIGLINPTVFVIKPLNIIGKTIHYFKQSYMFCGKVKQSKLIGLSTPKRNLSQIGYQLSLIAGGSPIEGFVKIISEGMKEDLGMELKLVN